MTVPKPKSKCRKCGKALQPGSLKKYCNTECRRIYLRNKDKIAVKSPSGRFIKVGKTQAKKAAWTAFSKYVRTKYPKICYTCGKYYEKGLQCGHSIPGRGGMVLFDEELCRPQCFVCNMIMRGRYNIFQDKLIQENSIHWMAEKLSQSRLPKEYSIQDYLDIEKLYKDKTKEL